MLKNSKQKLDFLDDWLIDKGTDIDTLYQSEATMPGIPRTPDPVTHNTDQTTPLSRLERLRALQEARNSPSSMGDNNGVNNSQNDPIQYSARHVSKTQGQGGNNIAQTTPSPGWVGQRNDELGATGGLGHNLGEDLLIDVEDNLRSESYSTDRIRQSIGMDGINIGRSDIESEGEGIFSDSDRCYQASKAEWQDDVWDTERRLQSLRRA